jgi:hypothetical protein
MDLVPRDHIVSLLAPILEDFRANRLASEGLGDYCHRVGREALMALLPATVDAPIAKPESAARQATGLAVTLRAS